MQDNKPVGGVVIRTEYDHGELELLITAAMFGSVTMPLMKLDFSRKI